MVSDPVNAGNESLWLAPSVSKQWSLISIWWEQPMDSRLKPLFRRNSCLTYGKELVWLWITARFIWVKKSEHWLSKPEPSWFFYPLTHQIFHLSKIASQRLKVSSVQLGHAPTQHLSKRLMQHFLKCHRMTWRIGSRIAATVPHQHEKRCITCG